MKGEKNILIKNQKILISWNSKNKEWYIGQGYIFTKFKDHFAVNPEHLHPKSEKKGKSIM